MSFIITLCLLVILFVNLTVGFMPNRCNKLSQRIINKKNTNKLIKLEMADNIFQFEVPLEDGYSPVEIQLRPLFENSVVFIVQYDVPFKLNVEADDKTGVPIVTKDGLGGEVIGDVLRATTAWSQGMNAAGLTSDIMSFAGNVKWRKSIFETVGAPFDSTVAALQSNTAERSQKVTLVFERQVEK